MPEEEIAEAEDRAEAAVTRFDILLANMTDAQVMRLHLVEKLASPEYDAATTLKALKLLNAWIWDDESPDEAAAKKKSHLKSVPKPENPNG